MQENQFDFIDSMYENLEESDKAVSDNAKYDITKHLRRIWNFVKNIFH
jgi:hypothetical protein